MRISVLWMLTVSSMTTLLLTCPLDSTLFSFSSFPIPNQPIFLEAKQMYSVNSKNVLQPIQCMNVSIAWTKTI